MNICEQAEAFRLLLLMGVVDKKEIISWADSIISTQDNLPEWLLDLSVAANHDTATIEAKLRELPGEWSRISAAYAAITRFTNEFQINDKFTSPEAAHMLAVWAESAKVNQEDRAVAIMPSWIADEVPHGYAVDQDIVESIKKCITHFAAKA
ncbi:MAG TPA: hypothetical protein VFE58_00080 [Tepidisphaeraceae bacterium]|jgi:hypothetical protein|nr:hypothetical protein [Tepidisphaeraceae bacterium]